MADKSADERIADAFASHHTCFSSCVACNKEIAALSSELEQVKKERDEWQRAADENVRTLGGVIERANARTERAIELRKYAQHIDNCQFYWSDRTCTCGLSDLLRDLDAEEGNDEKVSG